jgi:hypothetical protein
MRRYRAGHTVKAIAAALGLATQTVGVHLRNCGRSSAADGRGRWDTAAERFKAVWDKADSVAEVACKLNLTLHQARTRAGSVRRTGLPLKRMPPRRGHKAQRVERLYPRGWVVAAIVRRDWSSRSWVHFVVCRLMA